MPCHCADAVSGRNTTTSAALRSPSQGLSSPHLGTFANESHLVAAAAVQHDAKTFVNTTVDWSTIDIVVVKDLPCWAINTNTANGFAAVCGDRSPGPPCYVMFVYNDGENNEHTDVWWFECGKGGGMRREGNTIHITRGWKGPRW